MSLCYALCPGLATRSSSLTQCFQHEHLQFRSLAQNNNNRTIKVIMFWYFVMIKQNCRKSQFVTTGMNYESRTISDYKIWKVWKIESQIWRRMNVFCCTIIDSLTKITIYWSAVIYITLTRDILDIWFNPLKLCVYIL